MYAIVHTFPHQVDLDSAAMQDLGLLYLTIIDAAFDGSSNVFNYTARLVADVEVLLDAGFHSLECGSLLERERYIFNIQGLLWF